ncbi:MAG: enoyl-CoA hydratase/isomerase family protein [Methylocystis sp.]|nr:enoyl-CoA hydratase/isomerase family protein [Methylocystis sp.]
MSEDELLVSRSTHTGTICLNRPKALNSLTLDMVRAFAAALDDFGADPEICAVVVTGAGERGLCAGGDIRALYQARQGNRDQYKTFWREEYELNARIASFPKYYVAVMDGVVMGGGVGISAHGNRRIVTERTRLAMPETGIGFIPDVGGTWLLTRDGGAGIYMALSGSTVGAADAIHVGLADILVDSARLPDLLKQLANIGGRDDVDPVLSSFACLPDVGVLENEKALLDTAMMRESVEEIIAALVDDGSDFARQAASDIYKRSPTSLKLTHELLKRAMAADALGTCLTNEYRAACSLLETHDLYEGIRAAVIDKDHDPRWFPASVEHVPPSLIATLLEGTGDPEPIFRPWKRK